MKTTLNAISLGALLFCLQACTPDSPDVTSKADTGGAEPITVTDATESTGSFERYSAEQFFQTTTVFGSSINHDNSAVLVSSDESGVFNAYRYPLDGSAPVALTQSDKDTIFGVSWFPQDERILYTADEGGNELNHLYVLEKSGEAKDLTPGDKLKAQFFGWHEDDKQFYVATNERDERAFDLYAYSTDGYERARVFENADTLNLDTVSRDGRWLVMTKANSNADSDLFLVDLQSEEKTAMHITPHEGNVEHSAYTFTPDSSKLVYGTNEATEYRQAWSYDIASGERSPLFSADWDVSFVYYSKDGNFRVIGTNEDAQTKLDIVDQRSGKALSLPHLPAGDLRSVNFANDGKSMVFYVNSDTAPSNLYSYEFGADKVSRLTDTLNPEISEQNLVASDVVRFPSFDELEIPGLLYKPQGASAENKAPALIWIHGGPGGQSRTGYSAAKQHLVNQGYALFAVNNRGSSGYGKTFFHLDDKKHGEDDLQDIVYGKKYLQSLDWVDQDKIAVIGGSYGGYLTMAAMAFTDEFEAGINIFGVTNWERTLQSIPPWWESFKKALYDEMGDPATDAERHRRISPLFHADKIDNPVLVVQGANDPRVLQVESDEMVEAIRKNNVPVEYVLFPDEGHGFRKKANRITASEAYVSFLNEHLPLGEKM
ncbi:S9 family peptidase [Microbulbifer agarilyticus]|uniref:S9 family peptidase n=1 Tax=Microbulbifer agarilyticus TaxID=260552 RepID=UPI001CD6481C|nr:S9 family peptidase [Microbulbifer agarilyticus]MCA0899198.1 S9 family peptidase [Microbulbifer agarilyticus]